MCVGLGGQPSVLDLTPMLERLSLLFSETNRLEALSVFRRRAPVHPRRRGGLLTVRCGVTVPPLRVVRADTNAFRRGTEFAQPCNRLGAGEGVWGRVRDQSARHGCSGRRLYSRPCSTRANARRQTDTGVGGRRRREEATEREREAEVSAGVSGAVSHISGVWPRTRQGRRVLEPAARTGGRDERAGGRARATHRGRVVNGRHADAPRPRSPVRSTRAQHAAVRLHLALRPKARKEPRRSAQPAARRRTAEAKGCAEVREGEVELW